VVGSAQSFAPYALNTITPNTYSDNGLSFDIDVGGIAFSLGDTFTFSVEGGQFKWRKNAGLWSADTSIQPTVSLSDGLSAEFLSGAAPSWVSGDKWSFKAEAINGADQLRQPTDARAEWENSTVLTITPVSPSAVSGVFLCDHTFPSDAIITLQGSNDNFLTTPLNIPLLWGQRSIYKPFNQVTYDKYRITSDKGGSVQWVWLGNPLELFIKNGINDLGRLTKQKRLPGFIARKGLGVGIEHEAITQLSAETLFDLVSHACQYDDRRFGIVTNDNETNESSLVEYNADSIQETDVLYFQPRDTSGRLISISLTLDAAA